MPLFSEIVRLQAQRGPLDLSSVLDQLNARIAGSDVMLRWGIVGVENGELLVEVAVLRDAPVPDGGPASYAALPNVPGVRVAIVVPTGVGAAIGGFIGDAGPVAHAFEAVADQVLVHPNVVNGAGMYGGGPNSIYVDGYSLDQFFAHSVRLLQRRHKIGVLLDRVREDQTVALLNAVDAMRSVFGIDVCGYCITDDAVGGEVARSDYGHFVGRVRRPDLLFDGARRLAAEGATAIAVATLITGVSDDDVRRHYAADSEQCNPVGSTEALISRFVTWSTGLPCAHAPIFAGALGDGRNRVDPRAAAEVSSQTGFPCILRGLAKAASRSDGLGLGISDLAAVVVPYDCVGGPPALGARMAGVPLLAVKQNRSAVGISARSLDARGVVVVENYAEAIGFVACLRAGVAWETVARPLEAVRDVSASTTKALASTDG